MLEEDGIPNIFHFVFGLKPQRESFHLVYYLCLRSCLEINKPEIIYFYYHYKPWGKYWDLIKPHLTLVKVELIENLPDKYSQEKANKQYIYAHYSDFIRIEKLIETGGVYADIDTLFVRPVPAELYTKEFVIGKEPDVYNKKTKTYEPSLCNAFLMARKNSFYAKEWLRLMPEYFDGTWSKHSCYLACVLSEKYPESVTIESQERFYPFVWNKKDLDDLLINHIEIDPNVCSIHLWNHMWWEKSKNDVCVFHKGMMNEKHIREVDTSYNVLARRFLPENPGRRFTSLVLYPLMDVIGNVFRVVNKKLLNLSKRF